MKPKHTLALLALSASGCAVTPGDGFDVQPDVIRVEHMHVSHPLAGPPFGSKDDEEWLDVFQVSFKYDLPGRAYTEFGCGVKLWDSGFYGPREVCTIRTGLQFGND